VVQREHRLVALIVPEYDLLRENFDLAALDEDAIARRLHDVFTTLLKDVNLQLPAFSRLADFELREQEFEKTPTAKIQRYMYA
jgi:long-chain acyl-CoA synthetase